MDGLWFSAVTVTTVGYGDKAPITGFGRLIDSFWMIFGLISFGIFGGSATSTAPAASFDAGFGAFALRPAGDASLGFQDAKLLSAPPS